MNTEQKVLSLEDLERADRVLSLMDQTLMTDAIPPLAWGGVRNLIYTARTFREWIQQLGQHAHPRDLCQRWSAGIGYGSEQYRYFKDRPCTCGLDQLLSVK